MHSGKLLVRGVGKDEAYWAVMLVIIIGLATVGRNAIPREPLTLLVLAVFCGMAAARFTLFKNLDVVRTDWSMDDTALTIGEDVIPLEKITSVGVHSGLNAKGSRTLVIKADKSYRYPSVSIGAAHKESVRTMWEIHDLLQADLQARKAR